MQATTTTDLPPWETDEDIFHDVREHGIHYLGMELFGDERDRELMAIAYRSLRAHSKLPEGWGRDYTEEVRFNLHFEELAPEQFDDPEMRRSLVMQVAESLGLYDILGDGCENSILLNPNVSPQGNLIVRASVKDLPADSGVEAVAQQGGLLNDRDFGRTAVRRVDLTSLPYYWRDDWPEDKTTWEHPRNAEFVRLMAECSNRLHQEAQQYRQGPRHECDDTRNQGTEDGTDERHVLGLGLDVRNYV